MRNRPHLFCIMITILTMAIFVSACSGVDSEGNIPSQTVEPQVMPDGVTIEGIDVGGLTEQEVRGFFGDPDMAPTLGTIQVACGEDIFELDGSSVIGVAQIDELIAEAFAQNSSSFTMEYTYDVTSLKALVTELAVQMNIAPVDASYTYDRNVEGRFVYIDAVQGREVDPEAMFNTISTYVAAGDFTSPCQAQFTAVEPTVTMEDAKRLTTLVSSATSSFAKGSYSAKNRVFNMEKATGMMDGHVLNPGEAFSFNTVLGPRYTSHGWKLAGAINNGKSVQEPGGGVCQVSSTAFNSVLMADLTIVERAPHSWPLSYLPKGQDATINTGTQDFIFKNDRQTPVIIAADIDTEKKELTISIYGEPLPDNKYIVLVSERTGTVKQPKDEVVVVKSMKPGTSVVDREGRSGSRYETYKEYYSADGTLIERVLAYKTTYRAISTIIHKGPDAEPVSNNGVKAPPDDGVPTAPNDGDGDDNPDIPDIENPNN